MKTCVDLNHKKNIVSLLTSIWRTVLKSKTIDVNDRFLLVGGNSLNAIQIISEIEKNLSTIVPFSALFKYDTIAKLAIYLKKLNTKKVKEPRISAYKSPRYPLMDLQKSFYFLHRYQEKEAFTYNVPLVLKIKGPLDLNTLSESLDCLIDQYEIFHTVFYENSEGLFQEIIKQKTKKIQLISQNIKHEHLFEKILEETNKYIPLDELPLTRIKLFKLTEKKHVLLIVQPHIITDGWSLKIIKEELFRYYSALINKKSFKAVNNAKSYFEYVEDKIYEAGNQKYISDINYWKRKLEGVKQLNFPYDYPRSNINTLTGKKHQFFIENKFFKKIKKFSSENNITPFMLMAAVLNVLLSKYCYQEDINIGFPISGRGKANFERTVGLFANTLILRTHVWSDKSFLSLIEQVRKNCLEAYAHQSVAFNEIVRRLEEKRSFGNNSIFQVMLVWQDWIEKITHVTSETTIELKQIDTKTSKFDFTFELIPTTEGLDGFIEYNTSLFCSASIERLSFHFLSLLDDCIKFPKKLISHLLLKPMPGDVAKISQKLSMINNTTLTKMPCQVFEDQVMRIPSKVAIRYKKKFLTYSSLNEQANKLAHYIQIRYRYSNQKFKDNTFTVGIFLEKSIETIVSIIAVLKTGAAYVPIDTKSPEERIKFIISDSDCALIITKLKYKEKVNFSSRPLILLDHDKKEITKYSDKNLSSPNQSDDLMYIIYTSGTTGRPKGVLQTHFNVARLFYVTNSLFYFNESDVWLSFHSYGFDFSVWEMWGALLYGGCLIIPTEKDVVDPSSIYRIIIQHKVTVLNQTPSAFQSLMPECQMHSPDKLTLRYIIFGGESLNIKILSDWLQHHNDSKPILVNMYGITETTVHTTYKIITKADLNRRDSSNIGVPLDDMKIFITTPTLDLVPICVPGELLVGGNGLALGYLNLSELTRQKFILNPFDSMLDDGNFSFQNIKEDRLYRTGDLVRLLSDGSLEYLGRLDKQIKFNGFRIEPEEIESALRCYPMIDKCAITIKRRTDSVKLVAYYTLKKKTEDDIKPQILIAFLKKSLPVYMLPNLFIKLDRIPLTENMKINYSLLSSDDYSNIDIKSACQEKMSSPQETLALIWEKNLHLKNIGLDDNFFGIGGDSITCIKVTAEAREKGFSLNVSDMFKHQTIRQVVKFYWQKDEVTTASTRLLPFSLLQKNDINRLPNDSVNAYPISSLQIGMIYHTNYSIDSSVYVDVFKYRIKGIYESDCFMESLSKLVNAHPILRTTFHLNRCSTPVQIVHKSILNSVKINDLSKINSNEQEIDLEMWMEQQKRTRFNFETGPLFQITIHYLSDKIFDLGLTFHHSILDGWSVATLITALLSIYSDLLNNKSVYIAENNNYYKYIYLEKKSILSESHKNFWKNELINFHSMEIPTWNCEPVNLNEFKTYSTAFSKKLTVKLIKLSQNLRVSLDVILLAAFIKLLSILSNNDDILTGVVFNGRPSDVHSENTLGLFLNALPFRHKLVEGSWKDLILLISNKKSKIYPHRRYPLMKILEDIKANNLFNILFYFTNFHVYSELNGLPDIKILEQSFYERTNFSLTFNCSLNASQNKLTLICGYETDKYTHEHVQKISDYYTRILFSFINNIDSSHQNFEILKAKEKKLILSDWNKTDKNYNFEESIDFLIEKQAKENPNQTALIFNNSCLNYRDLIFFIDYFVFWLEKNGACPGDYIVVYAKRSIEFVLSILAILKMGCIYVPIDIMQPIERVKFIIEDVNCKLICTNHDISKELNGLKGFKKRLLIIDYLVRAKEFNEKINLALFPFKKENLAYVLYTSGSTGSPKGVMIKHISLLNFLLSMRDIIGICKKDRLLAITSFSFDISLLEVFLPLISGATCIIADQERNADPYWISKAIRNHKITCLQATPTTWKMLFDIGYQIDASMKALSGGEPLSSDIISHLRKSHHAWNLYGPTETTIWSTCHLLSSTGINTLSIGSPISNTKVYVLDRHLKPVPTGVPGELYISGLGVAKGYLHKHALSTKSFVENHFNLSNASYNTMYKTGDIVRWLPNGSLSFMGRKDLQFKIRGFRIEAGDIESALLRHTSIKKAVVLVRKNNDTDYLVAYIVLHLTEKTLTAKALRAFLLKKLPRYMLPERFIFLDSIPTTINGKIDLKALHAVNLDDAPLAVPEKSTGLLTNEEKGIIDIWCEILNLRVVSPEDNFFDLGGNSISALRMLQKVNDDFSINLSIRDLIESASLSRLAEKINCYKHSNQKRFAKNMSFNFNKKIKNPIVTLKEQGKKNPLFLIHPVGGSIFYYIPLSKRLLSDRPIHAIQDPGIEAKELLFSSLSEMIEFYIKVIKKYQPHGPYFIAGSSFGANACVEMARQLKDKNDNVAFVGLIDGWSKYPDKANKDKKWFENSLRSQLKEMSNLLPGFSDLELFLDLHWHRQQLLVQHELIRNMELDITLFKALETLDVLKPLESPHNNWAPYVLSGPKTYIVPGDHFTMHFASHADKLARLFDICLKNVDDKKV